MQSGTDFGNGGTVTLMKKVYTVEFIPSNRVRFTVVLPRVDKLIGAMRR